MSGSLENATDQMEREDKEMSWKDNKNEDWFTVYWDGDYINTKDDWYNGVQSYHDRTYAEAMRLIGKLKKNEKVSRIWLDYVDWSEDADGEMRTLMYIEKEPFRWHVDLSSMRSGEPCGWRLEGAKETWYE